MTQEASIQIEKNTERDLTIALIEKSFNQENILARLRLDQACVEELKLLTEGAGGITWSFTLKNSSESFIVKLAHAGDLFSQANNKTTEAETQKIAYENGVSTPEVVCAVTGKNVEGKEQYGYIMSYIKGESRPRKIFSCAPDDASKLDLLNQTAETLAKIHQLDMPDGLLPKHTTSEVIDNLFAEYKKYDTALPVFNLAFRYLKKFCPENEKLSFVHGDYRMGNFLVSPDNENQLTVLDWELGHIGNPLQDLGWLCITSWRFNHAHLPAAGLASYEQLLDSYEKYSQRRVSLNELYYWELLGVLRWGVICLYQCHIHLSGQQASLERAAIGRRISECEIDILVLLKKLNTEVDNAN